MSKSAEMKSVFSSNIWISAGIMRIIGIITHYEFNLDEKQMAVFNCFSHL